MLNDNLKDELNEYNMKISETLKKIEDLKIQEMNKNKNNAYYFGRKK